SAAEEQTAVAEEINRSVHQIAGAVDSVADEAQQGAQTAPQPGATGPGPGPAGRSVPHLTLPPRDRCRQKSQPAVVRHRAFLSLFGGVGRQS
ncbi:hypothetical protein CR64_24885, partial [Pseudomonas aeruginosa]